MNSRTWSLEETQVLREHYRTLGPTEIHRRFLPHRPINQIKKKAVREKVSGFRKPWTVPELATLHKHYCKLGPSKLTALLPGRAVGDISHKAISLGLRLGDSYKRIPLRRVAEGVNAEYSGMYVKAKRETNITYVGANKYRAMVPIEWAEKVIREFEEWDENARLANHWYDMNDLARILGFTRSMVTRGFKKMGSLWDCFEEIEIRRADRVAKKLIVNPYQVERLATMLRRGEAVLSNAQALVLMGIARGDTLRIKARPVVKGASPQKDEYWLYPVYGGEPLQVKAPAVRRCIDKGLIERQRNYRQDSPSSYYALTDLGRQAVEGLEAAIVG
jgi:hypothetical protein